MKLDGLQVFVAAVLVGNPLAGLARIVEVEHGRDRIHAQAVDVILLQPEQRVRNQKRAHFVPPVVEDLGAPFPLLALARIGVLIERRAIEEIEAVRVLGEMRGHPIDNHSDARLVAAIHQVFEIVRRAEARRGREVADHLIAPRARKRMLHDGQKLDVRVAHQLHVFHQVHGQLAITQSAHPGAGVNFVHRHRRLEPILVARDSIHAASPH
jgi:hypothetical protein